VPSPASGTSTAQTRSFPPDAAWCPHDGVDLARLDEWATAHHGIISRCEASELGCSSGSWYRAIETGTIELLHPGVARLRGSPRTQHQRIAAAVLAIGPECVASHRSAALLWGIERPTGERVDVIVPRSISRRRPGVTIHRPRDRGDLTPVVRAHIRCTNLLRTLVDLGAVDPGGVESAVEQAIVSGVVSARVLRALVERHARPGRSGVGSLRAALERWPIVGRPPDSVLEVRMARFLQAARLPPAEFHARVAGREVDFALIGTPIVLECDGWEHHGRTRQQFERDTQRDRELAAAGRVVVHFTWRQITRRSAATAELIRQLVATWAPDVFSTLRAVSVPASGTSTAQTW
jgi:very-short-patch-repair endonuclease